MTPTPLGKGVGSACLLGFCACFHSYRCDLLGLQSVPFAVERVYSGLLLRQ